MKYQGVDSWVPIFEAPTVDEAYVIKGMLEASKIPVILDRETAMLGEADGSGSEVLVKVPTEKVARAAQVLQSTPYGVPEQ
jgi:hypothetical protein